MTGERKPMSVDEVVAAAMDLSPDDRLTLLEQVEDSLYPDDVDPADLADSRRIMEEIKAGRMRTVPAEEVLEKLDQPAVAEVESAALRMPVDERAELADRLIASVVGDEGYDPAWVAEMNRRIDEIEAGTARTVSAEEVFAKLKARRHARSLSR